MRDRSGGILFVPLSFLVFLVLEDGDKQEGSDEEEDSEKRRKAARQDGGGYVWWRQCLASAGQGDQRLWREREDGNNLRTRVAVSWGIPWMYPRDRARRKVEREGEPKQR